jgi:hypothetical protein
MVMRSWLALRQRAHAERLNLYSQAILAILPRQRGPCQTEHRRFCRPRDALLQQSSLMVPNSILKTYTGR